VKDQSEESDCWRVRIDDEDNELEIYIKRTPTTTADFIQWKRLMKKVNSAHKLYVASHSYNVIDDRKSFNDRFIPLFCDALKNNTVITSLRVSSDVVNAIGMKSLCKVLQTHTTITYAAFYLYSNLSHSIGSDLEHLIIANKTLKTLEVSVTAEEAKFVGRALPHNTTLTTLNLEGSDDHHMGNKGLRTLCEGLKRHHSITNINLADNDISDEGANDLCSLLEANHSIIHINLRCNDIVLLPEGFAFLTHIKTLDLSGNSNLRFPPPHLVIYSNCGEVFQFFADFRCGPMKFHFLLGFHERVGIHSSIQSYLYQSSIFEPALFRCVFELT